MTQTISRTVNLGAANTGLALGYRVLSLDRTTFSAFTITDVAETTVLGTYSIDNGFVAPDAGGYIIWGTSGTDRLEGDIAPAAPTLAALADSVWDEARAGHVAAGSFGQGVASVTGAVGSVTAGVTVTTNNDKTGYSLSALAIQAIWDALTSALTTVGSIGKLLVDNLNATVGSRSSGSENLESGKTLNQAILDIWAKSVGDAAANDDDNPTSITYDSPDGTVQVTHTHTDTTRTKV